MHNGSGSKTSADADGKTKEYKSYSEDVSFSGDKPLFSVRRLLFFFQDNCRPLFILGQSVVDDADGDLAPFVLGSTHQSGTLEGHLVGDIGNRCRTV